MDLIDRQAAMGMKFSHGINEDGRLYVPFGEVIKGLKNLLSVQTCDDAVSRQAAIDALMKRDKELRNINWYDKPFAEGECKGIDYALEIVNALPSAQPEIIRCKDCKHHHYESKGIPYCDRIDYGYGWKDYDFCSRAERRTDVSK